MNGLAHSGIPLGGFGTGTVEFRADGLFHEWQIMNNRPWGAGELCREYADGGFFAVRVQHPGTPTVRTALLCTPPERMRNLNDPYALPYIEYPEEIDADVTFPFTRLNFRFGDEFPLAVELEAYSAFLPFDVPRTSRPAGHFRFQLRNISDLPLTIGVAMHMRNYAGYAHPELLSAMRAEKHDTGKFVRMTRPDVPSDASDRGEIVFGYCCAGVESDGYLFHPMTQRCFWEPWIENGTPDNRDYAALSGEIGNEGASQTVVFAQNHPFGALAFSVTIPPGATISPEWIMTWYFPNQYELPYPAFDVPARKTGHAYSRDFSDAADVFGTVAKERERLRAETGAFAASYAATELPPWLLQALSAQLTTLRKSSWYTENGDFGIWEGLGCCGLQTMDITFQGSYPLAAFFPELQKSQMRLSVKNIRIPGKIPHMMPGNFHTGDVDRKNRIDLIPQFVLLVWRDYLWSGDTGYLREMLPHIRSAFEFYRVYDEDGDGLPENRGPDQTYDQLQMRGLSSYIGYLYACARKAAAEMEAAVGDAAHAAACSAAAEAALAKLDRTLWNGRYFLLSSDGSKSNAGVMVDQLAGNWFYMQSCGASAIPLAQAKRAAQTVWERCRMPGGYLANCVWDDPHDKTVIGRHTANQSDWPWSGTEYAFAANLALLGLREEAKELCHMIYRRHECRGLRFKHVECGEHYYRALASWAVYLALTGQTVRRDAGELIFDLAAGTGKFMYADGSSCGTVNMGERQLTLTIIRGVFPATKLVLRLPDSTQRRFELASHAAGEKITVTW